jgi:hypothetical protein
MIRVVDAIKESKWGLGSNMFDVTETSLRRYVNMKDKIPEEAFLTKLRRRPVFSKDAKTGIDRVPQHSSLGPTVSSGNVNYQDWLHRHLQGNEI